MEFRVLIVVYVFKENVRILQVRICLRLVGKLLGLIMANPDYATLIIFLLTGTLYVSCLKYRKGRKEKTQAEEVVDVLMEEPVYEKEPSPIRRRVVFAQCSDPGSSSQMFFAVKPGLQSPTLSNKSSSKSSSIQTSVQTTPDGKKNRTKRKKRTRSAASDGHAHVD